MNRWLIGAAALALMAGTAGAYESVRELVQDFQVKQNEAMQKYLDAKPDAADAAEARQRLLMGYRMAGQNERALPLMQKQYAAVAAKGKDASMREVMGLASGIVETLAEMGRKAEGLAFIEQVGKDFAGSADAERIAGSLERMKSTLNKPAVGEVVELKFKALDGREVDLAAMKDKVVLIDFWATWCGPCRAELPHVKKAYADHHGKGFEIIAISLDREREPLDAFIKEQELPWPQYFDGKAWETDLAARFGVTGIPATFLVGKDGKIAASNLRGEALGAKVAELLAK